MYSLDLHFITYVKFYVEICIKLLYWSYLTLGGSHNSYFLLVALVSNILVYYFSFLLLILKANNDSGIHTMTAGDASFSYNRLADVMCSCA